MAVVTASFLVDSHWLRRKDFFDWLYCAEIERIIFNMEEKIWKKVLQTCNIHLKLSLLNSSYDLQHSVPYDSCIM